MSPAVERSPDVADRLRRIRERIRKHLERPVVSVPDLDLQSLTALEGLHSAADRLVDQVGSVNPRPPGLGNELLQFFKRSLAHTLDWFARPQREFNRTLVEWLRGVSRCLEETDRSLRALSKAMEASSRLHQDLGREIDSLGEQLEEQVQRLGQDLGREMATLNEQWSEKMKHQRWAVEGELFRLREELKPLRQRLAAQARAEATRLATVSRPESVGRANVALDYYKLEHRFRGSEEEIRRRQSFYVPLFQGRKRVLDLACGRGEFLELMRKAGVPVRGVDLDADMVGRCLEKGLDAVQADIFSYLGTVPPGSLDGVFCAHFAEHLEAEAYATLIFECSEKLSPSGILAMETPNPECLAIFSQTFFLDPTHVHPIPPALLRFVFAEAGLTRISTHFLSPAGGGLPLLPLLTSQQIEPAALRAFNAAVANFNETFFGGMDYAVIGYRPDTL